MLVEDVDTRLRLELCQVFVIIDEDRFDGLDGCFLDFCQELALAVAVGGHGGNLGGGYLLYALVLALPLIDCHIAVSPQIFVSPAHDVLLGDLGHAVDEGDCLGPILTIDESVYTRHCPVVIVLIGFHHGKFHIIDRSLDEGVVEVSAAQLAGFGQQQFAHVIE